MSHTDIVRALIQHFFNEHDTATVLDYFTPDFTWDGGLVGHIEGAESYAAAMHAFFKALPDAHAEEQDAVEVGDTVAMRLIVEGTHKGDLWGVAPSNRHVRWTASMFYRIADGRVAEQWATEDWAAILHGIGVFTPPWLASTETIRA